MSTPTPEATLRALRKKAPLFAALGDPTRLDLLSKLGDGAAHSITRLAEGSPFSRQAITKHLAVLHGVGLVKAVRIGRENLFQLEIETLDDARAALDRISKHWDNALSRLKNFVEHHPSSPAPRGGGGGGSATPEGE